MKTVIVITVLLILLPGCSKDPVDIQYGTQQCVNCEMNIADRSFAAQFITDKGKPFFFDAVECLAEWHNENKGLVTGGRAYIQHYRTQVWILAESAYFLQSEALKSPMGLNAAAFSAPEEYKDLKTGIFRELRFSDIINGHNNL